MQTPWHALPSRPHDTTAKAGNAPTAAIGKVAFIGSYLPRKCGIATFTTDLCRSVGTAFPSTGCSVVAINDNTAGYDYDNDVHIQVDQHDLQSYQRAATKVNLEGVDVVCLQHEFGVFGGPAGSHILGLLADLRAPIVTTLHTVLRNPDPQQNRVMRELIARSARLVVMTRYTRQLLMEYYQVPLQKIDLIPHGIPDVKFSDPYIPKRCLGMEAHTVLLTFGLLSPGKGIEYAIRAVAEIVPQCPDLRYVVLGATHPHLLREQGEDYRLSLQRLAKHLGIARNIVFHNRFVEIAELTEFISAADVYVTPYLNEAQAVSGALAYAFGCGKPVVSTPYWHARELLEDDRGILVPFRDSAAIARALRELLLDQLRRRQMAERAYRLSRGTVWREVAQQFIQSFADAVSGHQGSCKA